MSSRLHPLWPCGSWGGWSHPATLSERSSTPGLLTSMDGYGHSRTNRRGPSSPPSMISSFPTVAVDPTNGRPVARRGRQTRIWPLRRSTGCASRLRGRPLLVTRPGWQLTGNALAPRCTRCSEQTRRPRASSELLWGQPGCSCPDGNAPRPTASSLYTRHGWHCGSSAGGWSTWGCSHLLRATGCWHLPRAVRSSRTRPDGVR